MVASNAFGATTSSVASLTVLIVPPTITSPLSATGKQGSQFGYMITALHTPMSFAAGRLPPGLTLNAVTGSIFGSPLESGTFGFAITASNACTFDTETLVLNFASSIPVITSPLVVTGMEGNPINNYIITATDNPTSFGAQNLPLGLTLDPLSGVISGKPVYAGDFFSTISASNVWGAGSATLHFTFGNEVIAGLSMTDLVTNYSSPYLLDFQFSLKDNDDPTLGNALVVDPHLLSVTAMEDGQVVSPSETAVIVDNGSSKLLKVYLALDFTESIASLSNGDTNNDGISDAVDAMVAGAEDYVDQQVPGTQVGVYEFHRDDEAPQNVMALTTDHARLDAAISGIWTNYVQSFPAGSRAWDAAIAAITALGPANRDEQHYLILVSDGKDESSFSTAAGVISAALAAAVHIHCIGFGAELDAATLQSITSATGGRYYDAAALGGLTAAFDQIAKDMKGQYLLRWATLKRSTTAFMPSFSVTYQGFTAASPTNSFFQDTNGTPIINTNTVPPTTNYPFVTNYVISPYIPAQYTGNVTIGLLRLVPNSYELPESITLRASYVPRYVRQIRIHYRANWPCTVSLQSTSPGSILQGWSLTQTNDGAGGDWLLISSPNPQSILTSIPFGALGNLVTFTMRDMTNTRTAFSLFAVDNTIYTNTGGQSFVFETPISPFVTVYSVLPFGTPVPWLIAHGFTNNFAAAELSDPDGDGMLTWQEYQANTDPRDPNSKFVVDGFSQGLDGRYQITFRTSTNRTYRLDSSADLITWQTVQDNIAGTGGDVSFIDTRYIPGATQLFYRVAVR